MDSWIYIQCTLYKYKLYKRHCIPSGCGHWDLLNCICVGYLSEWYLIRVFNSHTCVAGLEQVLLSLYALYIVMISDSYFFCLQVAMHTTVVSLSGLSVSYCGTFWLLSISEGSAVLLLIAKSPPSPFLHSFSTLS